MFESLRARFGNNQLNCAGETKQEFLTACLNYHRVFNCKAVRQHDCF